VPDVRTPMVMGTFSGPTRFEVAETEEVVGFRQVILNEERSSYSGSEGRVLCKLLRA